MILTLKIGLANKTSILFYQYGRKYPFYNHTKPTLSSRDQNQTLRPRPYSYSVQNQISFITTENAAYGVTKYNGKTYPWNDSQKTDFCYKSVFDPSPRVWEIKTNGAVCAFSHIKAFIFMF